MTSPDLNGLLDRMIAIELEAFATLSKAVDSVPNFYHIQESFPYLTHRVSNLDLTSEDEDYITSLYSVTSRLVIGHITQGYEGENDSSLYTYIPLLVTYFQQRRLLQSAAYPTVLNGLMRAEMGTGASRGWTAFTNAGVAALQVGTEFTFICEFNETIEQAYN